MKNRILKLFIGNRGLVLLTLLLAVSFGLGFFISCMADFGNKKAMHYKILSLKNDLTKASRLKEDNSNEIKYRIRSDLRGIKRKLEPILYKGIDSAKHVVDELSSFIDDLTIELIDKTGNVNGDIDDGDMDQSGLPLGFLDTQVSRKVLFEDGQGEKLKNKIKATREKLIDIYQEILEDSVVQSITKLGLFDDEIDRMKKAFDKAIDLRIILPDHIITESNNNNNWINFHFKDLPLNLTLATLAEVEFEARCGQALLLDQITQLVGGYTRISYLGFFPIMNARSGYIVKGEKFEAEVAIGAFSSAYANSSVVTINGQEIQFNDEGRGTYTETTKSYGSKTLELKASVTNPETNETMTGSSSFDYIVGERSATMNLKKMNTLYIGVDNPIEVSIPGYAPNKTWVKCNGGDCKIRGGNGQYIVNVSREGPVEIKLSAKGFSRRFRYKAKKIPDPEVRWGDILLNTSEVSVLEFQNQNKLLPYLDDFDFEVDCSVQGFEIVRMPLMEATISSSNRGKELSPESQELIKQGNPGDKYWFKNIKVLCKGDIEARTVNSLIFSLK